MKHQLYGWKIKERIKMECIIIFVQKYVKIKINVIEKYGYKQSVVKYINLTKKLINN
jgi:hypothetical protein